MEEMRQQVAHFGTEFVQGNVTAVDLGRRPFALSVADGRTITTDALIIATGASARWLDIGSDRKLSGRGVSTCATCDGYFFKGKPIGVVGGGDSAMEEAIYLARLASKVTVIHRRDSIARVEDHAGQGARQSEDRLRLERGDRRRQGRLARRSDRRGGARRAHGLVRARLRSTACSSRSATRRTRRSFGDSSSSTSMATS